MSLLPAVLLLVKPIRMHSIPQGDVSIVNHNMNDFCTGLCAVDYGSCCEGGFCAGHPPTCYCDADCRQRNDCCSDIDQTCRIGEHYVHMYVRTVVTSTYSGPTTFVH